MGTKKYIKPDIREEYQILTVRAWVTQTQYVISRPTTATSITLQETARFVSSTSQALLQSVTTTSVALQSIITQTTYLQESLSSMESSTTASSAKTKTKK
jgi:hypothetical protein